MQSVASSLLQMAERRYDERDVAGILREAAENQASQMEPGHFGSGMTLAEIQRVANELGIDSNQVLSAVARRESLVEQEVGRFWGATPRIIRTRTSDSELDDSAWEEVVAELRATVGGPGTIGKVGSSNEWTGGNGYIAAHFSAKPQDGTTRFRITFDQTAMCVYWLVTFILTFISSIVGGALMSKFGVTPLANWGIILAFVALACFATNRAVARWQGRNIDLANSLLKRAEELVPESVPKTQDGIRNNLAHSPQLPDETNKNVGPITL